MRSPGERHSTSWSAGQEQAQDTREVDGVVLVNAEMVKARIDKPGGPLLVNHWATWCEGCVDELPLLARLHREWAEKVDFIGVSWEKFQFERPDVLHHVSIFSKEHGAFWPSWVVEDTPDQLFEALGMSTHTIPQIWVLNEQGDVIYRLEKVLDEEELGRLELALDQVTS
ncbi:MAG: TlpA disulfide reductase family protein [Myxococcota bacterium]|nr:TlpA disulfide reductase family protein [Myxococcota bacterium]